MLKDIDEAVLYTLKKRIDSSDSLHLMVEQNGEGNNRFSCEGGLYQKNGTGLEKIADITMCVLPVSESGRFYPFAVYEIRVWPELGYLNVDGQCINEERHGLSAFPLNRK